MLVTDQSRRIVDAIDERRVLDVARPMLRIPSFCRDEKALAEYLAERMHGLGMQVSLAEVEPGRPNAIGRLRGRAHQYNGVPVVVTYHPAYLLRNLPDKAKAWADLCLALDVLRGD